MQNFTVPETLGETIQAWDREIEGYLEEIEHFNQLHVIDILKKLSAFNVRAFRMRKALITSTHRGAETFRIKKLDPFMNCIEFQFKTWSRIASIMTTEWEISQKG